MLQLKTKFYLRTVSLFILKDTKATMLNMIRITTGFLYPGLNKREIIEEGLLPFLYP